MMMKMMMMMMMMMMMTMANVEKTQFCSYEHTKYF
ncbi:unnamed protein product [Enterobius vermicularis]|uniref:Uncharacterized protein n=1 Tax=Enterobius vermicularis TaxID=51028 RepID=A0A0N4VQA2_ENTVE|nr:unnamed protein product [Enterobius vermicularis]